MSSFLVDFNVLEEITRGLQKMSSSLLSGHIIDAWRECNRLLAYTQKTKTDLLKQKEDYLREKANGN